MTDIDENALFNITLGLYVVGSYEKKTGREVGCIADAVMQVSANPMRIAVSLESNIYTTKCVKEVGELSLSVLPKNTSAELISEFGFKSSENTDKWNIAPFYKDGKLPLLKDCIAVITCKVVDEIDIGDHIIFVCEVKTAKVVKGCEPLTYAEYRKSMRKASSKEKGSGKRWVCSVCCYEYDGDIPFEELPDDWKCPCCQMGKEYFQLQ